MLLTGVFVVIVVVVVVVVVAVLFSCWIVVAAVTRTAGSEDIPLPT